jgi:hypothetical protein
MTIFGKTLLVFLVIVAISFQSVAASKEEPPEVTPEGLHRVHDTKLARVYADPAADLSGYQKILLVDAQVAFRKNWRQDINRNKPYAITTQGMQDIRLRMSALFGEVFTEELSAAGYVLSDEVAADVLIVRPAIVDLDPSSPESASGRTRNITQSVGAMGLYLELRDSETGDILVKALDYQVDRSEVTAYMKDSTRNERVAREILTDWAQTLVTGLDEARTLTSGRGDAE